ncbi:MAG: PQQ-binding-like beta-propeller repeat protein [Pseudomonadota bacterium]|nr:PQQ-binding-like beta-propeller repeat protein [Pseudomonadota bacterium]
MTIVRELVCRTGLIMAAMASVPFGYAATPSTGLSADEAITEAADGMALYQAHCAACHNGQVPRAPHMITFSTMGADTLLNAMNNGVMRAQASALSATEREVLAGFLAGEAMVPPKPILACAEPIGALADSDAAAMQGWGGNAENHRHSDGAVVGLDRDNVDQLALKWVFAYPGALRARSQPLVHDGVIFVGSQSGDIYALDLESGCAHWTYSAGAEVRSSLSLGQVPGREDPVLYMGDFSATVHAIDASDGSLVWRASVGDHPDATITGSPKLHDGSLYVPISSSEWATAADPGYACCTFRGGVVSVDAASGELNWRAHVIDKPAAETGETNPFGAARKGPAGAPVWNSPTIDAKRGVLYVGTGEAYTSPAADTSDAVLAFSLATGERQWAKQLLGGDAWNMACFIGEAANCPEEDGPDLDIGASTVLWSGGERDYLLVGQKSGDVYALDPDRGGAVVWHNKVGRGGFLGGVHWGMSVNDDSLFVPIADTTITGRFSGPVFPGVHALDPTSGTKRWYTPSVADCEGKSPIPVCDQGMSAAITSTDQLVFAGTLDGNLKAYDSVSGEIIWSFDTYGEFESVSGEMALGGSIESDGPVLYKGHVIVNSGYQFGARMPGNALMVFSLPPKADLAKSTRDE